MSRSSYIVYFQHGPRQNLVLNAVEVVVNVRITQTWQHNASADSLVKVIWVPGINVPGCLYTYAFKVERIGGSDKPRSTSALRPVIRHQHATFLRGGSCVERIKRRVPTRVRKWVVKRSLIRNAEPTTHRGFACAKYVPRKTHARTKVVVVSGTQLLGFGETAGAAYTCQNRVELIYVLRTGTSSEELAGIVHLIGIRPSWSQEEVCCQIVEFGVASVKIVA